MWLDPGYNKLMFFLLFLQATGYMELPVPYSSVEDVHIISRWDAGQKFCIRVTIQDGSLLLQVKLSFQYNAATQNWYLQYLITNVNTILSHPDALLAHGRLRARTSYLAIARYDVLALSWPVMHSLLQFGPCLLAYTNFAKSYFSPGLGEESGLRIQAEIW